MKIAQILSILKAKMARSSSALPVVLLALAALFVAPAFVPSPAPRAAPEASAAAITAGAMLPLLTAQPAMAEDGRQRVEMGPSVILWGHVGE